MVLDLPRLSFEQSLLIFGSNLLKLPLAELLKWPGLYLNFGNILGSFCTSCLVFRLLGTDICFSLLKYIDQYQKVKIFNGNLNSYICNDIMLMNWIAFCALIRNKFYLVNLMKRQTKRRKGRSFLNCFGDLIFSFM